jgi:hypothetical protein
MEACASQDSTANADEGAKGIPPKCGVERMNNKHDAKLRQVLKKNNMADLAQFHQSGFFDEAPLYTRESDVNFLQDDERANEILLRFAVEFLESVIEYKEHPNGYFAAVTLWDYSEDLLVPNIFVWCGPVEGLKEKLSLKTAATTFGTRIKEMLPKLRLADSFKVLEDTETEPGSARIFIGPTFRPYEGFVTVDNLRSPALNSR